MKPRKIWPGQGVCSLSMSERLMKINKTPAEVESKTLSKTIFPSSTHRHQHQHPLHNCKQIQPSEWSREQLSKRKREQYDLLWQITQTLDKSLRRFTG
jgi:hypothetical protein